MKAGDFLLRARQDIESRGQVRDQPDGERAMERTVNAFNELFKTDLTETQGWMFMAILKIARSTGGKFHADDYQDLASYGALAGECASRHAGNDEQAADGNVSLEMDARNYFIPSKQTGALISGATPDEIDEKIIPRR